MSKTKAKTKVKEKHGTSENLAEQLNRFSAQSEEESVKIKEAQSVQSDAENDAPPEGWAETAHEAFIRLSQMWDKDEFKPQDFMIEVPVDSLESRVGYTSLLRQMQHSFIRRTAFYMSPGGGTLSLEEALERAFRACQNHEEAAQQIQALMRLPVDEIDFADLYELFEFAPRQAEKLWERFKSEGRKEFESGHLAANITFPVGYMKQMWNIARYLGVRESFINDWKPKGGIEVALIDMMAQSYFQWQYWLEQTVKRSQTPEREEHPDYQEWQRMRKKFKEDNWTDGRWLRPSVSEERAIEHAVKMADRFNRIFMRTLRQLRDLRRYSVTINNPKQVNIATVGGQQVNVSNADKNEKK